MASSVVIVVGSAVSGFAAPPASDLLQEPKLSPREEKFRDERVKVLEKGKSTRSARLAAMKELPLDHLTSEDRRSVEKVLDGVSLFRELPTVAFEVDHDVYRYFLRSPEAAVAIWKTMGVSKFQMRPTSADSYEADCGDGTSGTIRVLYRSDERCLLLCDGAFKNPLLARPVKSQCVVSLDSTCFRMPDNRPYVKHKVTMFVSFPSQTIETAARVMSPVSNVIIDHNFREVSLFLHMMSQAMRKQPGWVERTVGQTEIVENRKQELLKITAQVYLQNRKRELARDGNEDDLSIDDVLAPLREANASQAGERPIRR